MIRRTKGIRRVSKKRAATLSQGLAQRRRDYLTERACVLMPSVVANEVHEVIGGRFRERTMKDSRYWLGVSRWKHDELQNMPKARQWALKALRDPDLFDLKALSELPGSVVSAEEVLLELVDILSKRAARSAAGIET